MRRHSSDWVRPPGHPRSPCRTSSTWPPTLKVWGWPGLAQSRLGSGQQSPCTSFMLTGHCSQPPMCCVPVLQLPHLLWYLSTRHNCCPIPSLPYPALSCPSLRSGNSHARHSSLPGQPPRGLHRRRAPAVDAKTFFSCPPQPSPLDHLDHHPQPGQNTADAFPHHPDGLLRPTRRPSMLQYVHAVGT